MEVIKSEQNQMEPMQNLQMMLGNVLPPQLPQLDFDHNMISGFFHNRKLARISKASAIEAEISENRLRTLNANLEVMKAMATFTETIKLEFRRIDHEIKVMELIEMEKQTIIKTLILESQIKEHQVKEAEYSAKTSELEFRLRLREMEKEMNNDY